MYLDHNEIPVTVFRTLMIGGGNSYDVYVETRYASYRPIAFGSYATVIVRDGKEYYEIEDMLRDPENDALPVGAERSAYFNTIHDVAERIKIDVAKRAFPELRWFDRMPTLWTNDSYESDSVEIIVPADTFANVFIDA